MPNERIERFREPPTTPENPVTKAFERLEPRFPIALRYIQRGKKGIKKKNIYIRYVVYSFNPFKKIGIVQKYA